MFVIFLLCLLGLVDQQLELYSIEGLFEFGFPYFPRFSSSYFFMYARFFSNAYSLYKTIKYAYVVYMYSSSLLE